MKFAKGILLLLLFSVSTPCLADLCQDIQRAKAAGPSAAGALWNYIKLSLFPELFTQPDFSRVAVPNANLVAEPARIKYRNIVFTTGPLPEAEQKITVQQENEFARLEHLIQIENVKYAEMIHSEDYGSCIASQNESGFSEEHYKDLLQQERNFQDIRNRSYQRWLDESWNTLHRNLILKWEMIRYTDINQVRDILSQGDVANVVFFVHGAKDGEIADSGIRAFPLSLFDHLSPSILSISIFSCYGEKARDFYQFPGRLLTGPSYHRQRIFVHPRASDIGQQSVIRGFPGFLKIVDQKLFEQMGAEQVNRKRHRYPPAPPAAKCELSVSSSLQDTNLGVFLNQGFIGLLTSPTTTFPFPCSMINPSQNTVVIRSTLLDPKYSDYQAELRATLTADNGTTYYADDPRIFWNEDGTFRRAKLTF